MDPVAGAEPSVARTADYPAICSAFPPDCVRADSLFVLIAMKAHEPLRLG